MISYLKKWWNSEQCFAKNPLFWVLTAGACAAAPFTGFLSLAAIPAFAGLAQAGYLSHHNTAHTTIIGGDKTMNKEQKQLEVDEETQHSDENDSLSSDASLSSSDVNQLSVASMTIHANTAESIKPSDTQSHPLKASASSVPLGVEAVAAAEWLYHYQVRLKLELNEIVALEKVLKQIPVEYQTSFYSQEQQARFAIADKPGKPGIFYDDAQFEARIAKSGKKIGHCLLRHFHDDKIHSLANNKSKKPTDSQKFVVLITHTLTLILNNTFMQTNKESNKTEEQEYDERIADMAELRRQAKADILKMQQEHLEHLKWMDERAAGEAERAKRREQIHQEDLTYAQKAIDKDNQKLDFTRTLRLMTTKTSVDLYYIEVTCVTELINLKRLTDPTLENLMTAILQKDIALARRCLKTPENPDGFITKENVLSLFKKDKIALSVLTALDIAPEKSAYSTLLGRFFGTSSAVNQASRHAMAKTESSNLAINYKKKASQNTTQSYQSMRQ